MARVIVLWQNVDPFNHWSQEDVIVVRLFQSFILLLQILGNEVIFSYLRKRYINAFTSINKKRVQSLQQQSQIIPPPVVCVWLKDVGNRVTEDGGDAHNNNQDEQMSWSRCLLTVGRACATEILRAPHARNTPHIIHGDPRSAQLEMGRRRANISRPPQHTMLCHVISDS